MTGRHGQETTDASMDGSEPPAANRSRILPAVLVAAALAGLLLGWRTFWFLTDDAYIAFRYVSNRQLGFGYVWNPPPFAPVEGYTSFLWIVLLDAVWTVTGIEPPVSSNWLALGFGAGSVLLTALLLWRMRLCPALEPLRAALLALVLLGTVTNATFLTWTSSGLETALFNFLVLAWVAACLLPRPGSPAWLAAVSGAATLVTLARPDGLLVMASSALLIALVLWRAGPSLPPRRLIWCWPLAVAILHLLWRRSFYGQWVPNTYYAKHMAMWPESGVRYFLSFVLEYGLWLWLLLGAWCAAAAMASPRRPSFRPAIPPPPALALWIPVLTILAHAAYYTLDIGGDHFEYRVYSHLVPFVMLSSVWMMNSLVSRRMSGPAAALAVPALIVALSWPIPWSSWYLSRHLATRHQTRHLTVPMAGVLPPGLRWYGRWFDELQRWLIVDHAVGKRRREHAVFHDLQRLEYPSRRLLDAPEGDGFPVHLRRSVGVPGWILARINILDELGLNDYVIAHTPTPLPPSRRRMAHYRIPPPGYLECFRPNVVVEDRDVRIRDRHPPLTAEDIRACERTFRRLLEDGRASPSTSERAAIRPRSRW